MIRHHKDLTPDSANANMGSKRGRDLIETSIERTGAGRSIVVDKNGLVIAGNKTLEAAVEKGIPIEAVETEGDALVVVQRVDLRLEDGGAARELAYLDNRVAEVGLVWDPAQVMRDLDLTDLSGLFTDGELERIINYVPPERAEKATKPQGAAPCVLVFTDKAALERWRRFTVRLAEMFPEETDEGARLARFAVEQG